MSSQPTVSGIIYYTFIFEVPFLTTFCTSFWKRVHNLKEIVNLQGLFVLTVGYLDMTTYPLTKCQYIVERVPFIYGLFTLFLQFLYAVSWRYKRDYLHASIDILFYVMFYIINRTKNQILFYHVRVYDTKKRSRFEPAPQSTICSYALTPSFFAFHIPLIFARQQMKSIRNMHAVSTNQIADILRFNDKREKEMTMMMMVTNCLCLKVERRKALSNTFSWNPFWRFSPHHHKSLCRISVQTLQTEVVQQ